MNKIYVLALFVFSGIFELKGIFIKTIGKYPLQSIMLFTDDGRRKMILENINSKAYRLRLTPELHGGIYFLSLNNGKETSTVKLFLKD